MRVGAIALGFCSILVAGCGPEVKARGTGASGRLVAKSEAKQGDMGLGLINRLDPKQQKSFDWLHQKLDKVVVPAASWSADKKKTFEESWPRLPFADLLGVNGNRFLYRARIATNVGILPVVLMDAFAPNQVRSFLIEAQDGAFNGASMDVQGELAVVGVPSDKAPYTIPAVHYPGANGGLGALVMRDINGRNPGRQFCLMLDKPRPEHIGKLTVFGVVNDVSAKKVLEKIVASLREKNGSVRIERIEVARQTAPLFVGKEVALPALDAEGRADPFTGGTDQPAPPDMLRSVQRALAVEQDRRDRESAGKKAETPKTK